MTDHSHAQDPSGTVTTSRTARSWWLWPLLAAAAGFVAYLPALQGEYTLDDVAAVREDVRLRGPGAVPGAFTRPYLWDVPAARSPYRPVTSVTYALNWQLGDGDPFVFHLFNVLVHLAAVLALLSVLIALGAPRWAAGPAAVLFAVHPVHVEAVANIVGRADVLMTLFCLLGVRLYLSDRVALPIRIAGLCALYLLAVGAKENGYVFPVLLLLAELLRPEPARSEDSPGDRRPSVPSVVRARVRAALATWPLYAALTVTLIGYFALRRSVLGAIAHLDVAAYIAILPEWLRVTTAVANLSEVARLLTTPIDLSWHYGPAVLNPAGPGDPRFWAGVLVLVAVACLLVVAVRAPKAGRWTALGFAWIAATYGLLSNLILPMPMWLAERILYLPSVGMACLVVAGLVALQQRGVALRHPALVGSLAVLVLAGSARTWQYSGVWRTTDTLYTDLVERHPESFHAPWWIGQRLVTAGNLDRGVELLEAAVDLNPNGVMVTLDLTRALLMSNRPEEAEEKVRPIPRGLHASVSVYLAQSLIMQGRLDEARAAVEDGLRLFPGDERLESQRVELDGM